MSSPAMATDGANAATDAESVITMTFESKLLFSDKGWLTELPPEAASRLMPSTREQRKTGKDCDLVFVAADGEEVRAHLFLMAHSFTGYNDIFVVTKGAMLKKRDQEEMEWKPSISVVVPDLSSDMLQLLVDVAYDEPLHGRIGQHNVDHVLDMAKTYNVRKVRDCCICMLKENLNPSSCISTYHLALRRGLNDLAAAAVLYIAGNIEEVKQLNDHFHSFSPADLLVILMLVQPPAGAY